MRCYTSLKIEGWQEKGECLRWVVKPFFEKQLTNNPHSFGFMFTQLVKLNTGRVLCEADRPKTEWIGRKRATECRKKVWYRCKFSLRNVFKFLFQRKLTRKNHLRCRQERVRLPYTPPVRCPIQISYRRLRKAE